LAAALRPLKSQAAQTAHIVCRYRTIHERGLQTRENLRYYQKKPKCAGMGSSFVSVGIVDCYPALLLLLYGLLISVGVLLLEIRVHRRSEFFKSKCHSLLRVHLQ
jgi:hypothetical protein